MRKRLSRKGNSIQNLLGIQSFSEYGLQTERGELLFFHVAPINIAVLSPEIIEDKIEKLRMVLTALPGIEISCTDSSECFDDNKAYLRNRQDTEREAKVQSLIKQDMDFLDGIQWEMATARQFVFIAHCKGKTPQQVFQEVNAIEKAIASQGFESRRMRKQDIKRYLALYFDASMYAEHLPDIDGAQYCIPVRE